MEYEIRILAYDTNPIAIVFTKQLPTTVVVLRESLTLLGATQLRDALTFAIEYAGSVPSWKGTT